MRSIPTIQAEKAHDAIRALNHATFPGECELIEPTEACIVLGHLESTIYALPQALRQIGEWLARQQDAGRLRVAGGADDATDVLEHVRQHLSSASARLTDAAERVDAAHEMAARAAASEGVRS